MQLIQFLFLGCQDEKYIFWGPNIIDEQTPQASTEFSCRQKCQNNAKCKFWTWSNQNVCNLKDENALIERVENKQYISGTRQCPGKSLLQKIPPKPIIKGKIIRKYSYIMVVLIVAT